MPFFQNSAGIMNGGWCVYHLTGTYLSLPNPLSRALGTRHRHAGDHSSSGRSQATVTTQTEQLAWFVGLDASHRAKGNRTHRTHQCISVYSQISRVRSGCAVLAHCMSRAVPGLITNTGRVRAGDGR